MMPPASRSPPDNTNPPHLTNSRDRPDPRDPTSQPNPSDLSDLSSLPRQRAVALPRAHVAMAIDVDFDLAPLVIAFAVVRLIAEQVLIRQLVEELGERV